MELDNKTYNEYDAVYRYKKSIQLDNFFGFVILAPLVFVFGRYFKEYLVLRQVFLLLVVIGFSCFFLSDKIFKGASLGKRIYKIKLVSSTENENVPIISIIYRRFLEVWIHPVFTKMTFLEKSRYIDQNTGSRIVISEHKR
jgi:uncharacterized RDD family membrane protein YckC